MEVKVKNSDILIFSLILFALISNTFAKSRGSFKSGSSSSHSSAPSRSHSYSHSVPSYSHTYSIPSYSYSRPSYSYSRPSPSYSYSRPSPSYSYSRPSPSYSDSRPSPSYSNSVKAPSYSKSSTSYTHSMSSASYASKLANVPAKTSGPSYGWNIQSPSSGGSKSTIVKPSSSNIGWNIDSKKTKQGMTNIGWNVTPKSSIPIGPPPPYPGLQDRPVPSNNAPPAYYPSNNKYPANSQNHHSKPGHTPGYYSHLPYLPTDFSTSTYSPNYYNSPSNYYNGNTFGRKGLPINSYISNNYYGGYKKSGKSDFLTNALFLGGGYALGRRTSRARDSSNNNEEVKEWNEDDDKRWRATTKAPYFENKIPGEDKVLAASAVNGAAIAFGLISLLPLNVPKGMPLMYCNDTQLMQSHIQINDGNIYQCINNTIRIWCPQKFEDEIVTTEQSSITTNDPYTATLTDDTAKTENISEENAMPELVQNLCVNKSMECNKIDDKNFGNIYCSNGNLFSKINIFCNSTTFLNETSLLNCYDGELPENKAAYIPTAAPPLVTSTQKPLTLTKKVSKYLQDFFDMDENVESEKDLPDYTDLHETSSDSWYPEALTIPPTRPPYEWMKPVQVRFENGTIGTKLESIPSDIVEYLEKMSKSGNKIDGTFAWVKVYKTNPIDTIDSDNSNITD